MISFLRRHVFHNLGLKLVSIAAAALLWLAVARNPVTEAAVNVPLEFQHVPDNLEISSEHIPEVQIRVRGPERLVHDVNQSEVHVVIDLAGARPGDRSYDLGTREIRVPRGVEVVQVVPSQFRISFDRRASRQIEVRPRVIGTFASGFYIASVSADPREITIMGPEKRVNAIEHAVTDPVDATGVVGQATFTTHLYVPDPLVRLVRPEAVHVTVVTEKAGRAAPDNSADHRRQR
jgi:YbbR domain-containing protein